MAARPIRRRRSRANARLDLAALEIAGALLTPDIVARIAAFDASEQTEAGYGVPPGLKVRDEIARYFRIGEALWSRFEAAPRRQHRRLRALRARPAAPVLRLRHHRRAGPGPDGRARLPDPPCGARRPRPDRHRPGRGRRRAPERRRREPRAVRRRHPPPLGDAAPAGIPERPPDRALGSRERRPDAPPDARQHQPDPPGLDRGRPREDLHGRPVPRLHGALAPDPPEPLRRPGCRGHRLPARALARARPDRGHGRPRQAAPGRRGGARGARPGLHRAPGQRRAPPGAEPAATCPRRPTSSSCSASSTA